MQKIKYYTDVHYNRNKLFVRGLDENYNSIDATINYQPTVWVDPTYNYSQFRRDIVNVDFKKWTTLVGNHNVVGLTFKDIGSCRQFVNANIQYDSNGNRTCSVYTPPSNMFVSQYLTEHYKQDIHIDSSKFKIFVYDIETEVGHRNVPDTQRVTCRRKQNIDGIQQVNQQIQEMTIVEFESMIDNSLWELLNEQTQTWVGYDIHPYRYLGGFPSADKADEKVTLITVKDINQKRIVTWGLEDFVNTRDDVEYRQFDNEKDLLKNFVEFIEKEKPHIMSGWNISTFDNVYIANRIKKLFGDPMMNRLSPYHDIEFREVDIGSFGRKVTECSWKGIVNLDYLKLYKKFTYGNRESYKLDDIAYDEVGVKKIPNPTGGGFKEFYTGVFDVNVQPNQDDHEIRKLGYKRTQLKKLIDKDPTTKQRYQQLNQLIKKKCKQLFIEYNIRDVELVDKIDAKQHFFDLIITIAYMARCNFEDVFSPVKTWDYMIYFNVNNRNQVIPIKQSKTKAEKFPGAYVKEPLVGKHEFCESYDLDSLYPHLLMAYNISPETMLYDERHKPIIKNVSLEKLISKEEDLRDVHVNDYSMAATGVCFTRKFKGIIPILVDTIYADRKKIKKKALHFKNEHEKIVNELRKRGIEV